MLYPIDGGYKVSDEGYVINKRGARIANRRTRDGDTIVRLYIRGVELKRSLKHLVMDSFGEMDPLRIYVKQHNPGPDFSIENLYRSMWR